MDNGELSNLEKECKDIADKLGKMLLQEKGQTSSTKPTQKKAAAADSQPKANIDGTTAQKVKKKKNKKKKNKKKANKEEEEKKEASPQQKKGKGRRNRRRRPFEDRYYGRFHCKICNRMWESSWVFTVAGTKIVKYKQGCKECDSEEAWYFPYALDIIRCSVCGIIPCDCQCEECDGLIHIRYWENQDKNGREEVDPHFEYCDCEREKHWHLGLVGDLKKPHLSQYCGKCRSGRPCRFYDPTEIVEEIDGES